MGRHASDGIDQAKVNWTQPASPVSHFPTTCTIFPLKYTYVITPFP
jgi:hypothetical protein